MAAAALKEGFWGGVRIALVPLLTETVVLVVTALFVAQVPTGALRWMGIAGGALVVYLAWRTWNEADHPPEAEPRVGRGRSTLEAAFLAVLSPAPWVFWLLVGSPLLLASWRQGWGQAAAFLGSFLFFLVGIQFIVAGLAAYGHRELPERWRQRLLRAVALLLLAGGVVLVWQSWIGNFHELVAGTEALPDMLDESLDL